MDADTTKLEYPRGLTLKQKHIVSVASCATIGHMELLRAQLNQALDASLTINEIKEILIQLYAYCGFPRSLNALNAFQEVVQARINNKDNIGEEGEVLPKTTDKFAYGDHVQQTLTGKRIQGGVFDFAPAIDTFLKEHLFADIFCREVLTYQEREIATIAMLASRKGLDAQLNSHIQVGENTGLTETQIQEILQQVQTLRSECDKGGMFGLGEDNVAYANYFSGKSFLKPLTQEGVNCSNVTFEPGCRNHWHIHHKSGQILLVISGRGYYQAWGEFARELIPGDVVSIPPEVKHWHGAAKDSWFSHLAISVPVEGGSTEWCEPVEDKSYDLLK